PQRFGILADVLVQTAQVVVHGDFFGISVAGGEQLALGAAEVVEQEEDLSQLRVWRRLGRAQVDRSLKMRSRFVELLLRQENLSELQLRLERFRARRDDAPIDRGGRFDSPGGGELPGAGEFLLNGRRIRRSGRVLCSGWLADHEDQRGKEKECTAES